MRLISEQDEAYYFGMRTGAAPDEFRPGEAAFMQNLRPSLRGGICSVWGDLTTASARPATGITYGLIEFETAAGVKQLVMFADDTAAYSTDEGETWTSMATALREDYWSLVIIREGANNVLCAANGGTNSYQWNGAAWSTIANIPSGVKYLAVHGERLIAAGHSGVDVVASKVNDIDTWANPDGWTVRATTHDGDTEITGLFTIGSVILVFKRKSVGYIEGYGYQTLQVAAGARGVTKSVGCVAFRTIQAVDDDAVVWLSDRGFELYRVGQRVQLVSLPVQALVDNITWWYIDANPGVPTALWYPAAQEYWCSLPIGTPGNEWVYVYRPERAEGGDARPAAHYLFINDSGLGSLSTVGVDEDGNLFRGSLWASEGTDINAEMQWVGVNQDGDLFIIAPPGVGGHLTLDPETELHADDDGMPASLAMATRAGKQQPCWGDPTGFLVWAEEPKSRPTNTNRWIFKSRPYVGGDRFRRKKAKRLRVAGSVSATSLAALEASGFSFGVSTWVIGDGLVVSDLKALFFSGVAEHPQIQKRRVGGRAVQFQVYMSDNIDVSLHATELLMQQLQDQI